jgi:hypothetical protein
VWTWFIANNMRCIFVKWFLLHVGWIQACCRVKIGDDSTCGPNWMRMLLTFFISCPSWVLADIIAESSHHSQKCHRNPGCKFCMMVYSKFWADYFILIYINCQSRWSQWGVMAACHFHS